jgi:predicted transcriptional regulator
MEIVYRRGEATAQEVMDEMEDSPSYSTIRSLLVILENKGFLKHTKKGARYNYQPTHPRKEAARKAISKLVQTFFDGSAEKVMAALLDSSDLNLSDQDLRAMEKMIRQARSEAENKDLEKDPKS